MTDAPRCTACLTVAIETAATHASSPTAPWWAWHGYWCAAHALPCDVPLAGAVETDGVTDEMLKRAFEIPRTRGRLQTHEADDE